MDKLVKYYQQFPTPIPLSIQINLLNRCFQRCIGCRKYEWPNTQLDLNKLFELLSELNKLGTQSIVYSGGEPTLYKNFNSLIQETNKQKLDFGVLTSAIFPKTVDIDLLVQSANYISISIDGATKETFRITRGSRAFQIVIENTKKLIETKAKLNSKCRLRINSTISTKNIHEMVLLLKLANALGIDINFFPLHTWNDLQLSHSDTKTDFTKYVIDAFEESLKISNIQTNISYFMSMLNRTKPNRCIIPYVHCVIDTNGDILPCCRLLNDNLTYNDKSQQHILGNIYNDTFSNIWFSDKSKMIRKKLDIPLCKECYDCDRYNDINKNFEYYLSNSTILL